MMNVKQELSRLSTLTVGQLRGEYQRVCGEPTRSNNRAFLIKRVAWNMQAASLGGLTDRARARAHELARDQDVRLRPPQELHRAFGDLAEQRAAASNGDLPPPGSVISRMYRGRRLDVRVVEGGFEFERKRYTSLSAIAKAITGATWNGRLFFGLTRRPDRAMKESVS